MDPVVSRPRLRGWSHLLAVPFAIVAAVLLIVRSVGSGAGTVAATSVFGGFLVAMFAVSAAYHVPAWERLTRRGAQIRGVLRRADHATIQLFVAATFTPIAVVRLGLAWSVTSLVIAWAVAVTGAVLTILPGRSLGRTTGILASALGWAMVAPLTQILPDLPMTGSVLVVAGGLAYSIGAISFVTRWPDPSPRWFGYHEVWHLFVLAGAFLHAVAIHGWVLPG